MLKNIEYINKHGGVIIIDSTRKGKKYPDRFFFSLKIVYNINISFSRTIPIWTCVINKYIQIHKKKDWDWFFIKREIYFY